MRSAPASSVCIMTVSLEAPGMCDGPTAMLAMGRLRRRTTPTARLSANTSSSSSTDSAWVGSAIAPVRWPPRPGPSRSAPTASPRRNHREHVRLLLDYELDQRRPAHGVRLREHLLELAGSLDTP